MQAGARQLGEGAAWLTFSNWKLMIFGLALILMMRFRPEGLLPSAACSEMRHRRTSTAKHRLAQPIAARRLCR